MTRNEFKGFLSQCDGEPSLYVGTYAKYNDGNLSGAWIDVSACSDADEFFEVCRALHDDEDDPEFMFQDYDCIPESLYSESMNEDDITRIIDFFNDYDESEREIIEEYWSQVDGCAEPSDIMGKYMYHGDFSEFVENVLIPDLYPQCEELPSFIYNSIDWEHVSHELSYDYHITDNFVFSAY